MRPDSQARFQVRERALKRHLPHYAKFLIPSIDNSASRKSRAVVAYRTSQYDSAFGGHTMLLVTEPATEKRWRSKLNHLTYPGHICMELLHCALAAASSSTRRPVGTSIVHEASDAEHPYAHTHFAWWWSEAPNLHGTALFDVVVDGVRIHPHAVHKKSWRWMQGVFTRYHFGFKTDAAGKPAFVAPVGGPWQVLPAGFEWDEAIVTEVSEAHDLIAGVHAAGVKVRSVHDVLLLQNAKRPLPFEHNFDRSSFCSLELPPAFVARQVGTLHIWGAPLLGKTEWNRSRNAKNVLREDDECGILTSTTGVS